MTKDEIKEWLDEYKIKNYTINDDLTVDVNGNVHLLGFKSSIFPFHFGKVSGSFYCDCANLESLKGAPISVGGNFHCSYNNLKSLKGAPTFVGGSFICWGNDLKSLKHLPKFIGCYLHIDDYLNDTPEYKRHHFLKALDE